METSISIEGIECHAFHGCLPEESLIGGRFVVDVCIHTNLTEAMQSDDLKDTVDYVMVTEIVKYEMAIPSKLIEHAGARILKMLSDKISGPKTIELKIKKIKPPVNHNVGQAVFIAKEFYP